MPETSACQMSIMTGRLFEVRWLLQAMRPFISQTEMIAKPGIRSTFSCSVSTRRVRHLAQMEAASSQAIMMLVDCGRPFSLGGEKGEDRGFSESFGKDRVVIAYADAPGTYHPDGKAPSLFADAFARNVVTPDRISIQSVLRRVNDDVMHASEGQQRPWFQTSLDLPIYFRADLLPEEAGEPSAEDSSPNSPRRYKKR